MKEAGLELSLKKKPKKNMNKEMGRMACLLALRHIQRRWERSGVGNSTSRLEGEQGKLKRLGWTCGEVQLSWIEKILK